MGVQPSKAEAMQQKQKQQEQQERITAEPQRPACIDAVLAAAGSSASKLDAASKAAAASSAESDVIPAVDSIASVGSAPLSPSASVAPTASAIDAAAPSSSVASALTRSSTFQQLASFRHAEAQRRLSLGGCAVAASSVSAASSAAASAPRSRRRSVIGLQPEDRVSAEDVRRWSCSINQADAAHSSSPTQSTAGLHAQAAHSHSHSHSSLLLPPGSNSCSPPTIVRYGVQSAEPLRSMRHHSASSLSSLSPSSGYSSSLRSTHRLHVSSQLAHCANCGRMDHGEVLLWLDSDARFATAAAAVSSPSAAAAASAALPSPSAAAAAAAASASSPAGLIYCSKECYWSSRARRGNFDDPAEEEDCGDENSAAERAAWQLRLAAAAESFRPLSPSPRVRTILTAAADENEADAEADAALLRKQAEIEGASEIPPTMILSPHMQSHSHTTAALAVPTMRRARS